MTTTITKNVPINPKPCGWLILILVTIDLLAPRSKLVGQELQENFPAVRALGMGGASTSVANDDAALWTNPAGVSRARKPRFRDTFYLSRLPAIGLGANKNAKSLYSGGGASDIASVIKSSENLGENNPYWANANLALTTMFNYTRTQAGALSLFNNNTALVVVESSAPESARVNVLSDSGVAKAFNLTNQVNRFNVGIQVRYVNRYAYEDIIATDLIGNKSEITKLIKQNANKATAIGVDFGMLYTLADFWFPTMGLSILNLPLGCRDNYLNPHSRLRENVCGTLFRGNLGNEDALSIVDPTDFRAGLSITPRITRKISLKIALEMHHLYFKNGSQSLGLSSVSPQKQFHGGVELFWGHPLQQSYFSLRLGVNQGFLTTGASIRVGALSFDVASYGVDISSTDAPIEDRRQLAGISLIF